MRRFTATAVALATLFFAPALAALDLKKTDRFGGLLQLKSEATGWFRVEKFDERWLFVTPDGHGYLALGANHIGKYLNVQAEEMGLYDRIGGDREEAADYLIEQMLDMGLNSGEAYAPIAPEIDGKLPWVANINFPGGSKFAFDVFDPKFQKRLHQSFVKQCANFSGNPWVLGVACADLPVWDKRRVAFYEKLPPESPGARELARFRSAGKSDDLFLGHVADTLYREMHRASKTGAPNHLFFGERFRLRGAPDEVIAAVGPHVDVFCTQALILSPQRPPEWQLFQQPGYDFEHSLTGGKPMIVIDWAAPFSLGETFDTEKGEIRDEKTASEEAATWIESALKRPYLVGVFKCQFIGLHGNDKWFEGRARRTYLKDDGTKWAERTRLTRDAHHRALTAGYSAATRRP